MKFLYFLFFWWVFTGIAWLLGLPPGLFETIIIVVLGFAGAAISTVCLRMCIEWLPPLRKKGGNGLVVPPHGISVLTKYKRIK